MLQANDCVSPVLKASFPVHKVFAEHLQTGSHLALFESPLEITARINNTENKMTQYSKQDVKIFKGRYNNIQNVGKHPQFKLLLLFEIVHIPNICLTCISLEECLKTTDVTALLKAFSA